MADTMNLTGFKELAESLRELGPRVARNTLRRAVAAGATPIRTRARERAPKDTGEMAKDIQIKREKTEGPHVASYSVFVRTGKKSRLSGRARNVEKNSWYWRLVEFGTVKMAAQPFLRPSFEELKESSVKIIGEKLDEGIQAEATKLARGQ